MNADLEKPPEDATPLFAPPSGGFDASALIANALTLAQLPLGARLVLRCRKDWRAATVISASPEQITLAVGAPSGHTYRVRRPTNAPVLFDGAIPVLGEGCWRAGLVRYDLRW